MKRALLIIWILTLFSIGKVLGQDVIYKLDGSEIKGKIEEVQSEVIYYHLDSPDGPLRNIRISEVFLIIYADGTRKTFVTKNEEKGVDIEKPPVQNPLPVNAEIPKNEPEQKVINNVQPEIAPSEGLKTAPEKESYSKRKTYLQLGFAVRTFTDSGLKNQYGEFLGLETQAGVEIIKDLTAELCLANHWKKLDSDEKFKYWEAAVIFDYHPAHFYLGAGPAFVSFTNEYYDTSIPGFPQWHSYSDYAIGFTGRIGYEIRLAQQFHLYWEIKYTNVTLEDGGEKLEVANFGTSIGLRLF